MPEIEGRVPHPAAVAPRTIDPAPPASEEELPAVRGVSPQMVLQLLELRLNDMDTQMERLSTATLDHTNRADALSRQIQGLEAIKTKADDNGGKIAWKNESFSEDDVVMVGHKTYESVFDAAKDLGLVDKLDPLVGDGKLKKNDLSGVIEELRQALQRENSGNELRMMQLQELTQRRSQMISLASNLLRTLHQANQAVIRNLTV
ncbi:MAG: hypothetical protein ACODAU_01780 [Myxococcota bacterium]